MRRELNVKELQLLEASRRHILKQQDLRASKTQDHEQELSRKVNITHDRGQKLWTIMSKYDSPSQKVTVRVC